MTNDEHYFRALREMRATMTPAKLVELVMGVELMDHQRKMLDMMLVLTTKDGTTFPDDRTASPDESIDPETNHRLGQENRAADEIVKSTDDVGLIVERVAVGLRVFRFVSYDERLIKPIIERLMISRMGLRHAKAFFQLNEDALLKADSNFDYGPESDWQRVGRIGQWRIDEHITSQQRNSHVQDPSDRHPGEPS